MTGSKKMAAYVYMMANKKGGVLYVGVTSDLVKRISEHRQGVTKGFTSKYNVHMLVYYEIYEEMAEAILREKRMKKLLRFQKIALIEKTNSEWDDLYAAITA